MKTILERHHFTGWKIFPVLIHDKNGREVHNYQGLSVIGRCRSTSFEKSEIIKKQLVPNGTMCKYYKGISI